MKSTVSHPKPLDPHLFHHPPNPAKVALLLEELGLRYEVVPVDTAKGDSTHQPFALSIRTARSHGDRRHRGAGRPRGAGVRFKRDPALPRRKDRAFLRPFSRRPSRTVVMAVLHRHRHRSVFRSSRAFPACGTPEVTDRHGPVSARDPATWGGAGRASGRPPNIVGGDYSIADMSAWGWLGRASRVLPGADDPLAAFPNVKRLYEKVDAGPAAARKQRRSGRGSSVQARDGRGDRRQTMFPSDYPESRCD